MSPEKHTTSYMLTIRDILDKFSATAFTQKEKGTQFERLMKAWLKTDPRYAKIGRAHV